MLATSSISSSGVQPTQWGYQFSYNIPPNVGDASSNGQVNKNVLEFQSPISAPRFANLNNDFIQVGSKQLFTHKDLIRKFSIVGEQDQESLKKKQEVMLVRRQESLEERVNLLNARIEHQESITQNHVRKLENQDKMLSAARLDRIEREQVECLYC